MTVSAEPIITPEMIGQLAVLLLEMLYVGRPISGKAYARLLLREVSVSDNEIRIRGSKQQRALEHAHL